jgi:putative membrane protein
MRNLIQSLAWLLWISCWNLGVAGETAVSVTSTAVAFQVEPETQKDGMFWRRPSVDAGLRYSSNDWFITLISTPTSFVLKRIRFHLLSNVVVCLAVIYLHPIYPKLSIPMTGHSLLSSSLGLLLSYRTNSAYGRFWEARGHWTKTKSTCRNLAVMMKAHIEPHSPKSTAKFLELLAVFPATLMHLCLGGAAKLPNHAQMYIPSLPAEYLDQPALPAIWVCMQLQKTIRDAELESRTAQTNLVEAAHHNEISHLIDVLMDNMSSCEKILRTPLPWTYSRHTSRFLTLWMGTLPLALVGTLDGWLVMAIVIAASYCMLGIEEIGHLIEQPFLGDPLDGDDLISFALDADGEASEMIKRGRATQPYDIGIPVCTLAAQIRREVESIAAGEGGARH